MKWINFIGIFGWSIIGFLCLFIAFKNGYGETSQRFLIMSMLSVVIVFQYDRNEVLK